MPECDQRHSWNYHDYIGNRADHEYRAEVPALPGSAGFLVLYVSKVGGGTLGESYKGAWYYQVIGCGLGCHGDDLVAFLASRLGPGPSADLLAERLAAFAEGLL